MPTTRKSASSRSSTGPGKQSTLPFTHRVTKTVPKPVKDSVISSNLTKPVQPEEVKPTEPEDEVDAAPIDAATVDAATVDAAAVDATPEPELEPEEAKPVPAKSEAEVKAEKIGNAAIERYWRNVQSQRMAKQVHQDGLTTGERLLRYFDVSSQYGPFTGITRVKRWQRAQRLGLNPPIEVLAVLLKEESKGNEAIEKAHMDDIMNPTLVAE